MRRWLRVSRRLGKRQLRATARVNISVCFSGDDISSGWGACRVGHEQASTSACAISDLTQGGDTYESAAVDQV